MPYCIMCGKQHEEDRNFCGECEEKYYENDDLNNDRFQQGFNPNMSYDSFDGSVSQKSNYQIAGFVLGLVSIMAWIIPIAGIIVTVTGIVFSAKSLNSREKGMASAGLILSIIFLVLASIVSIIFLLSITFNVYVSEPHYEYIPGYTSEFWA